MNISEGTAKLQIAHLLTKLGLRNRTQAVVLALQRGEVVN
ncbi:LuxR C-terminal-related transcriptional regulator [Microseira sp. BLCC-F43]